jgi:nicotinate-nucleotide pyrophosphorylase (carboxylating)
MKEDAADTLIEAALKEDMPQGDITSESVIPADSESEAIILAKEEGVMAGINVAERVFHKIDPSVVFEIKINDGQKFKKGQTLATIQGPSISLLKGERTALNFLQRMSGIATTTQKFVQALQGTKTKILDTRKTTPGLRHLEKYAVKMGGGGNHRFNRVKVEVEATSLEEVQEAVQSGADMIMLDNMSEDAMKEVVKRVKGKVPMEVSGKVSLSRVKEIASLGVDFISVGSLTHSYKSVDISIEFLR